MKKSVIIKDLQEMLASELLADEVKYIDKDWGQLTMEQPPVGWPCVLIDIEAVEVMPLNDGNEKTTATIVLTVANKRTVSSSSRAPRASKEKSYDTLDLTDTIHALVQNYRAHGAEYSPLRQTTFYKTNDLPGAEVYTMRYVTHYNNTLNEI